MPDRPTLTSREQTVTELVAQGRSNREIAQSLSVSLSTVKSHLSSIMRKWNCNNRTQVALEVVRRRGLEDDGGPDSGG